MIFNNNEFLNDLNCWYILKPGLQQKPYLLRKHDRELNSWNVRKCETVYCYENVFIKNAPNSLKILENKYIISFIDLVMFKKMVAIFFLFTFALVTERVPKIIILTFVPITNNQCQLWAMHKHVFQLIPTERNKWKDETM